MVDSAYFGYNIRVEKGNKLQEEEKRHESTS